MAKRVEPIILGVDTSKDMLDTYRIDTETFHSIPNSTAEIDAFVKALPEGTLIAIEATNSFHEQMVMAAQSNGLVVYVVDALRLSRYRDAVGVRAKTDLNDARLLARYLSKERHELRPYPPVKPEERRIWRLLTRRAKLVAVKTTMRLAIKALETNVNVKGVDEALLAVQRAIDALEREAYKQAQQLGWQDDQARLEAIPGIGKLSALALLLAFRRAPFRSADAFVAYLGLDVRVRESGRFKGKRKLTKQGPAELRRLLFLAGRSARRTNEAFRAYFDRLTERGITKTGADAAVGRKLARIAFSLLSKRTQYQAQIAN